MAMISSLLFRHGGGFNMKRYLEKAIYYFGVLSLVLGCIQIVIGQIDYNSLLEGLQLSYFYFAVGFILIGMDRIIELMTKENNKY